MAARLKRIASDPLLHFLLVGAVILALYGTLAGREAGAPDRRIVLSVADQAQMAELWAMRWGRPPTPQELRGLLDARVREEVLYREALALGLDQDDTIVRRRLAQKMEFLFEDLGGRVEPEQKDLRAYLAEHPDRFREPARLTLSHVYVSADIRGESAVPDAELILTTLRKASPDGDPGAHGDAFPLARAYTDVDRKRIASVFGAGFADRVLELSPGTWQGPVESGYGIHLVFVHRRTEPRLPEWEDVEQSVRDEWLAARRREANEASFATLRESYDVVIEEPAPLRTAVGTAD